MAAAATAAIAPPAFTMNLRRSVVTWPSSLLLPTMTSASQTEALCVRWDIGKLICRWVGAAPRRLARMGTGLGASLAVSGPLLLRRDRGTSPERPAS